ncbi:MAG: MOSC domain-containing protein [Litorimonas sp.]
MPNPTVIAVASDANHNITKPIRDSIALIAGYGVEGDAHAGTKIQHRYDKRKNPDAPNLRQVHLMHSELFEQVEALGLDVEPGQMGENITTRDIDILNLPRGTRLQIGDAIIEITGLRNPCKYLNEIAPGLMKACIAKHDDGAIFPQSGVMGIVLASGKVRAGDEIHIITAPDPHERLKPV